MCLSGVKKNTHRNFFTKRICYFFNLFNHYFISLSELAVTMVSFGEYDNF